MCSVKVVVGVKVVGVKVVMFFDIIRKMPLGFESICISMIKSEATLSAKNRLQELYQKQKLPLPIYDSTNLSSVPHIPSWRATVTLYDGTQYDSPICSTKTKAEIGAAECALKVAGVEYYSAKPLIVEKHFDTRSTSLSTLRISLQTRLSNCVNDAG